MNRIKEFRQEQGLTQTELSRRSGVPASRIGQYERGDIPIENVTVYTISKIAKALNVSIDSLVK